MHRVFTPQKFKEKEAKFPFPLRIGVYEFSLLVPKVDICVFCQS